MSIQKLLRENLEKVFIKENRNEKLVQIGMENSFDDLSMAKNHLKTIMKRLKDLPDTFNLYRIVFVNDPKEVNTDEIGSHYVLNRKELENTHHSISHVGGGEPFMLTVKVNKSNIDINATLLNQMKYPHENEITMSNKGKGGKIINIEPMEQKKSPDFEFDDFSDDLFDY